jgi:xanthine dehydrogenase small subunit
VIRFLLNNKLIYTELPPAMLLLDFVRYHEHLKGTKIGCREGDCGACTVLTGELKGGRLSYRSVTSCLTALGNVHGKQVVTIEGLNMEGVSGGLNPLQQAICEENGMQCGFCTPGFIVSMAGFCLSDKEPSYKNAIASVDGNICRCTGYKSIERALVRLVNLLEEKNDPVDFAVETGLLPAYFKTVLSRLLLMAQEPDGVFRKSDGRESDRRKSDRRPIQRGANGPMGKGTNGPTERGTNGPMEGGANGPMKGGAKFLGGGTDLYVQQHETLVEEDLNFLSGRESMKAIVRVKDRCIIGGAATVTDLMESPVIGEAFPLFDRYAHLISSTPIRNMATVAGNFVNASPIGDLSIFFLALDARLLLSNGASSRELPLRELYRGYKLLNKSPEEFIELISFDLPGNDTFFHFEKVSKRTCLDIASVNTALKIVMEGDTIREGCLSAGGVGPVPAYLARASAVMKGRVIDELLVLDVVRVAGEESAPISDARGAADYKRLLLGQLIKAHFLTMFPKALRMEKLLRV